MWQYRAISLSVLILAACISDGHGNDKGDVNCGGSLAGNFGGSGGVAGKSVGGIVGFGGVRLYPGLGATLGGGMHKGLDDKYETRKSNTELRSKRNSIGFSGGIGAAVGGIPGAGAAGTSGGLGDIEVVGFHGGIVGHPEHIGEIADAAEEIKSVSKRSDEDESNTEQRSKRNSGGLTGAVQSGGRGELERSVAGIPPIWDSYL